MGQNHDRKSDEVFTEKEWKALTADINLPPRLSQIAYHLICGDSDKQIAMALKIGLPTVRTHIGRLFSKLGVEDRQEVAVFFFRLHRSKYSMAAQA